MKKKIIVSLMLLAILSIYPSIKLVSSYGIKSTPEDKSDAWVSELRSPNSNTSSFFESSSLQHIVTPEQLIDDSLIIVRGKLLDVIGVYDYTLKMEDNNTFTIPRCLMDFDLQEVLKGDNNVKNVKITYPGEYAPIETNKEYVLCLYRAKGDYEDAYCIAGGLDQGVYDILYFKDDNARLSDSEKITNKADEQYKMNDFKKLIKDVKAKNDAGIPIETDNSKIIVAE